MITLTSKQTQICMILVSLLFGLVLALWPMASLSQTVASQQQTGSVLAIEKLGVQGDGTVTGEIRNNSKNTVRDVQLFIRYTWLWANEFHPGKDSPSAAFYPTVSGEIVRRDSPGWIDALQIQSRSTVVETFGWQIRTADGFRRGLHASYFPE